MRNDPVKLAGHQVRKYWVFLYLEHLHDDIDQEIQVALLECPPSKYGLKQFGLCLNRRLYSLAKSAGYRKRHVKEGPNERGQWWERPCVSLTTLHGL